MRLEPSCGGCRALLLTPRSRFGGMILRRVHEEADAALSSETVGWTGPCLCTAGAEGVEARLRRGAVLRRRVHSTTPRGRFGGMN